MIISIDRRTDGAGGREVKFTVMVKPLDQYHTHGELTRCDRAAVTAALVKAANEIEAVLRRNDTEVLTPDQVRKLLGLPARADLPREPTPSVETGGKMHNAHRVDTAAADAPLPVCGHRSPDGLHTCDKARGHSPGHGNDSARRGW